MATHCAICGDEENLGGSVKYWSPDDGWRFGRLCRWCGEDAARRGPRAEDFAVYLHAERRGIDEGRALVELVGGALDAEGEQSAIDEIYG